MIKVKGKAPVPVAISLGDAWGISRIRLPGQSVLALMQSPTTKPNVSAYRPEYLLETVIGVWEVIPLDSFKLKTYRMGYR